MAASLVVLTGASGSGKTALAHAVQKTHPACAVFFFDSIGVPSAEAMLAYGTGHQPGGAWQRAMTFQWIERITAVLASGRSVLFEGQMRIAFIREAIDTSSVPKSHVILVECNEEVRTHRLTYYRKQPELASEQMQSWARYLREEAVQGGYEILDTGNISLADAVKHIVSYLT